MLPAHVRRRRSRPSHRRWPKCRSRHRTQLPCCAGTGQTPATPTAPPCASATRIWTHAELLAEAERFAALFRARLDPARPPHVGLLLDNTPDYVFALCGAGLAGVAVAGLNHTRVGEHLARDIVHTDVQFLITEPRHQAQLERRSAASICREMSWFPIASPTRTTRRLTVRRWPGRSRSHPGRIAATDGASARASPRSMPCGPCCSRPGRRPPPRRFAARSTDSSPRATGWP